MNEVQVVQIETREGKEGYMIVGTRQQCIAAIVKLEKNGEGHWYPIGYYEHDPRNEARSLVVMKFFYGKPSLESLKSSIRASI